MGSLPPPPATTRDLLPAAYAVLRISEQHLSAPHREVGGCCSAAGSSVAAPTGKQAPGASRVNRPSVRRGLVRDVFDADGLVGRTASVVRLLNGRGACCGPQARSRGAVGPQPSGVTAIATGRDRRTACPQVCGHVEQRGVDGAGQAPTAMRRGARHRLDQTALTPSDQPSAEATHSPWARRATSPGRDAHR